MIITYLIIAFSSLFILAAWVALDYYMGVVAPVNREIMEGTFFTGAETIHDKIKSAKTLDDCRRIQSNIIGFDRKYDRYIDSRILIQTTNRLWGELDARQTAINAADELRRRPVETGTITIDDLLKT